MQNSISQIGLCILETTAQLIPSLSRNLDWRANWKLDFSRPEERTDNAVIESFNGWLRRECLDENCFLTVKDAQEKLDLWREDYNHVRPHSSLGQLPRLSLSPITARRFRLHLSRSASRNLKTYLSNLATCCEHPNCE